MSDDRRYALTLIAFIGSVFSPAYFRSRQLNRETAQDHCAMNVALYGSAKKRWAFTQYGRESLESGRDSLVIGRNVACWDGSALTVRINERTAPFASEIRGTIRLHPQFVNPNSVNIDAAGLHHWQAIAPRARLDVDFAEPRLRWSGSAYLDTNRGAVPLDESFDSWTWARADLREGAAVIYEAVPRQGSKRTLALHFTPQDNRSFMAPPTVQLPATVWRVPREIRCEKAAPRILTTLEDGPFYARSVVAARWLGESVTAVHESLSLSRFRSAWVRALLPFRMRSERRR